MRTGFFKSKQIDPVGRPCLTHGGGVLRAAICVSAFGAVACGTTPLDSVVAERISGAGTGGDGGGGAIAGAGMGGALAGGTMAGGGSDTGGTDAGGSGGGAAPDCQTAAPGRFLVRDRADRCIQRGAPDTVFGAPIYNALLDPDCESFDAQWDVLEVVPRFYALLNVGVNNNLDVRAGAVTDGTPIVLYMPHPNNNQLFAFVQRTPPYYALEPQNVTDKCVEVVGTGAELFPCDESNEAQDFSLTRVSPGCL
jgi:hypothetical protein